VPKVPEPPAPPQWCLGLGGATVTRANESPPAAKQVVALGHDRAVRVSGTYAAEERWKVDPASPLWATAPVPTAGVPFHTVPTMAHTVADGHSMSNTSATGGEPVTGCHVWPPSELSRSAPFAGTTLLTEDEVEPAARQSLVLEHVALRNTPMPLGTEAKAHVCPWSVLSATAPSPVAVPVGTSPATRHGPPVVHDRSSPARKSEGRLPSRCQACPKLVLVADQTNEPSFTMTRHWVVEEHETDITVRAPFGMATGFQVTPAFVVATTTPLPGSDPPLVPTAMQWVGVGHDTPLNCGVLPPVTCCCRHVRPPFLVATITVAEPGRAAALGLATPTAQQRRTVAHDNAPSSPVPAGPG